MPAITEDTILWPCALMMHVLTAKAQALALSASSCCLALTPIHLIVRLSGLITWETLKGPVVQGH